MKKGKKNWDDLGLNDAKIPLNARVTPQLKNKLMLRAENRGITLSEVVEGQMALDEGVYLKEKEEAAQKIASLESQIVVKDNTIAEMATFIQSKPANHIKMEQELTQLQLAALKEQQEAVTMKTRMIENEKQAENIRLRLKMFADASLTDNRIHRSMLEKVYEIPFNKKVITAEGFLFEAVFLNPEYYVRKK